MDRCTRCGAALANVCHYERCAECGAAFCARCFLAADFAHAHDRFVSCGRIYERGARVDD